MTTKHSLLLAVLVVAVVAPVTGFAAAASTSQQADLAVQQPEYVDEDVTVSSENGSRVYHVHAGRVEIAPRNFQAEDVVAYGVETAGGRLTYDEEFEEFVFEANQTGTYTLYWTTENQVTVNNSSGNGTHLETRQYRYETRVRVDGDLNLVHLPADSITEMRENSENWEEFNATVNDLRNRGMLVSLGLKDLPSTEETIQAMITAYLTFRDPLSVLTGNFTAAAIIIGTSVGGILFGLTLIAPFLVTVAFLYRKYNTKESIEAQEGRLSKRLAEFEQEKLEQAIANKDFNDIWRDDHIADAMRHEGDNPLQAWTNWASKLRDRFVVHSRLQAMSQCGYVAVVDERTATDGGTTPSGEPLSARVVHEDDLEDDHDRDVVSLEVEPDDPLLDALDWGQDAIEAFDLVEADFDRGDLTLTPVDTYDLRELMELSDLDMRHFSDEATAAQYLRELFQDIREHPVTDDHGTPDTLRYALEQHLDTAHLLRDRFEMPIGYRVDVLERALVEFDAGAEAQETLRDVKEGAL